MKLIFGLLYLLVLFVCGNSTLQSAENATVTEFVFLQISIGSHSAIGVINIGVFGDLLPITVKNFVQLAKRHGMGYKGSQFHKIVRNCAIIGGDYVSQNGTRSQSIYGQSFSDENYVLKHYGAGWVSMFNDAKDKNGSKFLISLKRTTWMDNEFVVFGKVLKGMRLVRLIANMPTDENGKPTVNVTISNSGSLNAFQPFTVPLTASPDNI